MSAASPMQEAIGRAGPSTAERLGMEVASTGADTPRLQLARLTQASRRGNAAIERTNKLNHLVLEGLYRQEPLLQRAVKKKTGDLVKHGFSLILPGTTETHPATEVIQAWWRDTRMDNRVREALVSALVQGDGLLEIEWSDNGASNTPVAASAYPVAVHLIDPSTVHFQDARDTTTGEVTTFLIQDRQGANSVTLHPDRYHHFVFTHLPGYRRGLSGVEAAYHAAIAKVKGDQGLGEVLYKSGVAKLHATVKDAKAGELEAVLEMLTDPDFAFGFVWDDRLTIDQLNPTALNPQPFYEVLEGSIAAAIGLPVMFLKGAQAGKLTGSETNITDYHADLRQEQVLILEPFVERLVVGHTGMKKDRFDIKWNDPPVDKSAMATMVREQATAFLQLKDGGLTKEAAARIAGLDVQEDDFEEDQPGLLPPVRGVAPLPLPAETDAGAKSVP